jgi:hypothetical protein
MSSGRELAGPIQRARPRLFWLNFQDKNGNTESGHGRPLLPDE